MNKLELTYHPYELKLSTPFETSKGKISERKGFIVSIKSQSGKIGIGEVSPLPEFGSETYEQAEKRIAPMKIAMRVGIEDIKHSLKNLLSDFNSHPALRHGLEQAITNLICNERNITLAELLGLKLKKEISVNAAIGFQTIDEAVHSAKKFVEERFKTIKIKTGRKNFDEDYNTIKAIRESVGDEIKIRIDSNGKWSVNQAAEYLNRLQEFSIEYAEQPVNSADEFKELKQKTSVPLAADESIRDIDSAKNFISEKNIDYVILKPMMLGGLIPALDIIELAEKNNVIPVITSSFESAIGRANAVIAAASVKSDVAHGLAVSKYFEDDIAVDKYAITNGTIRIY